MKKMLLLAMLAMPCRSEVRFDGKYWQKLSHEEKVMFMIGYIQGYEAVLDWNTDLKQIRRWACLSGVMGQDEEHYASPGVLVAELNTYYGKAGTDLQETMTNALRSARGLNCKSARRIE